MLHTLSLTNFQKHRALRIDFQSGLNLIVGPNWAGKSTIQRAILFALFGARATGVTAEDLVTRGEKSLSVTLALDAHQIERSLTKARLTRRETGEVLANGHAAVTAAVEDLLGLSAAHFKTFRCAAQKEVALLLQSGSTKLGQLLDEITGIGVVDQVLAKLKREQDVLAGRLQGVDLEAMRADYQVRWEALAALDTRILDLSQQIATAEAERDQAEAAAQAAQAERARLLADQDAARRIQAQHEALEAKLEQLDDLRHSLGDCPPAPLAEQIGELTQRLTALEDAERARASRSAVRERVATMLQTGLETLQTLRQQLKDLSPPDTAAEDELRGLVETLREEIAAHQHTAKALSSALHEAVCPTCKRPFKLTKAELKAHEATLAKTTQDIDTLTARVTEATQTLAQAERTHRTYQRLEQQLHETEDQVHVWQEEVDTLAAELANLPGGDSEQIAQLRTQLARAESTKQQRAEWSKQVAHLDTQRKAIEKELTDLPEPPSVTAEAVSVAVSLADAALDERRQADQTLAEHQRTQTLLQQDRAHSYTTLMALYSQLDEGQAAQTRQRGVERLVKYLRANRDRFSAETWEQVLSFANAFVSSATGGGITALSRTQDGDFVYEEAGRWMPIALASGLQEDILGTGLKLALSAAIGGPADVALFDEVSAAGSDDNALLMTSLLRDTCPQTILISHRQADAAVADHVIELA